MLDSGTEDARHRKKAPRHKKFGIQQWSNYLKAWGFGHWYSTEKARDQAYDDLGKKTQILRDHDMDSPLRKIER